MKILFITHSFNSLTQRLFVELTRDGHDVSVEFDINDEVTNEAVEIFNPDLIVAPFLKRAIPESICKKKICFIVHPGIVGDRGPSALDWALLNDEKEWGVTVLQAEKEMDAGPVWASENFKMRNAAKSSIYRNEITEAAVHTVKEAIDNFTRKNFTPFVQDYSNNKIIGRPRQTMKQLHRKIDWKKDDAQTVLRKINCSDGAPGALENIFGEDFFLFNAKADSTIGGQSGNIIGRNDSAILFACNGGSVCINHLKKRKSETLSMKLPAHLALGEKFFSINKLNEATRSKNDIFFEVENEVVYLRFDFYNGAMSAEQCKKLMEVFKEIKKLPQRVIVLFGGNDFWSNGIHLNVIEASERPAEESLNNINAINDLAREIILTNDKIIISALRGNCAAGGVFLALAADFIWARSGVILNPHYKNMGNLYGSEYWTYQSARRKANLNLEKIMRKRLPIGTDEARRENLINDFFGEDVLSFEYEVKERAKKVARDNQLDAMILQKKNEREKLEKIKPLEDYREEEIERMKLNFFGFDSSYHVARYNFVHRVPHSKTPLYLAKHRQI